MLKWLIEFQFSCHVLLQCFDKTKNKQQDFQNYRFNAATDRGQVGLVGCDIDTELQNGKFHPALVKFQDWNAVQSNSNSHTLRNENVFQNGHSYIGLVVSLNHCILINLCCETDQFEIMRVDTGDWNFQLLVNKLVTCDVDHQQKYKGKQYVFKGVLDCLQAGYSNKYVGEGAYSTVFKVIRESDKQVYALKKVKLANLSQKEIENALNEVRILASIKNINIVGYKQVFLENKNLCIVMEYLDDGDLYQKIVEQKKKKEFFEEKQIWNVLIQILYGLHSLHNLNILHRDLKSANVFLNKDGSAKLGDLNVSKVAKNGLLYTQTGTPYYASPQVWKDAPYDMKSDIWSLGCVIYEMTTLMPPFQAEDMEGLYTAVTTGLYEPIDSRYSKELAHIIKLMLNLKPKTRPSTQKILKSMMVQKKIEELTLNVDKNQQIKEQLMKTIRIPKNLHYLTDKLPRSNYGDQQDHHSNYTLGSSPQISRQKRKTQKMQHVRSNSKGSLPKVNQLSKGSPKMLARNKYKAIGDSLMVQGKSKIIAEARSQQKNNRHLERQIKEELKKIYKIKGSQSNDHLARRKSDRSMLLPPIKL